MTPEERAHYSDAWAEMESVLGRPSFHAVFDHMRELAAVRDPAVRDVAVLPYFTRKAGDPVAVKQVGVAGWMGRGVLNKAAMPRAVALDAAGAGCVGGDKAILE